MSEIITGLNGLPFLLSISISPFALLAIENIDFDCIYY